MDTPSYHHSLDQHLEAIRNSISPPIFSRDFAYADSSPVVLSESKHMAEENIADFTASTFAEYVLRFTIQSLVTSLETPTHSHLGILTRSKSDKANKLFKRLLSGPIVDIYVGLERRHWSLHQNLLCHYSPYFEYELQGHDVRRSGSANTLDLPDDDPRGFELLVKWLYQGRLDNRKDRNEEEEYEYAVACQKLYTLSARLHLQHLSNLAIDVYRTNLHSAQLVPDAEEINEIYASSPPRSKMRKLMVKIAARQIMDPGADKDAEAYRSCFEDNADFAVEMVNAIRQMSGGGVLFEDPTEPGDECRWHDHKNGENCTANRKQDKIASPGIRRRQPMQQKTPRKLEVDAATTSAISEPIPQKEVLQPTTFTRDPPTTPQNLNKTTDKPSPPKAKPRKLERTPPKPPSVNATSSKTPSIANESRKITPIVKPQTNGHPNGVQMSHGNVGKGPAGTNKTVTKVVYATPRGTPNANLVNGIVRQFNYMNGTTSESSMSGSTGRRQPPKLRRRTDS